MDQLEVAHIIVAFFVPSVQKFFWIIEILITDSPPIPAMLCSQWELFLDGISDLDEPVHFVTVEE